MHYPFYPSFLLLIALISSYFATALPLPAETPLPGRTGISRDKDGTVVGHYGDDWMPQHMQHVKDNQEEYPQNKQPFHVNDQTDRGDKTSDKPVANHPVTDEPLNKDEKPQNMQKIPGGNNDGTTVQHLPAYESGGQNPNRLSKINKEIYDKKKAEFLQDPNNRKKPFNPFHREPHPDGSVRSKLSTTINHFLLNSPTC